MFKRRTLIVLGAGASAEVDFPIGTGLATAIKSKMDIRFEGFNKNVGSGDNTWFVKLMYALSRGIPRTKCTPFSMT